MAQGVKSLAKWPRSKNSKPFLNDTRNALYYAQLIWRDQDHQTLLKFFRDDCYVKLKYEREAKDPNLDHMFALAFEAHLFRQCLEECQRINDEPFSTILEGSPLDGA